MTAFEEADALLVEANILDTKGLNTIQKRQCIQMA